MMNQQHQAAPDPAEPDAGCGAAEWYGSERLRRLLGTQDLPMSERAIQSRLVGDGDGADPELEIARMMLTDLARRLAKRGFIREHVRDVAFDNGGKRHVNHYSYFRLSEEGRHTLDWAGAPKPDATPEQGFASWASELSREIARSYGVSVHEMLKTGRVGRPAVARARLCFALYARGWTVDGITRYFGLPTGWSKVAIDAWRELKAAPEKRAMQRTTRSASDENGYRLPIWACPPRTGVRWARKEGGVWR